MHISFQQEILKKKVKQGCARIKKNKNTIDKQTGR
jgi:hypothetical protein